MCVCVFIVVDECVFIVVDEVFIVIDQDDENVISILRHTEKLKNVNMYDRICIVDV